MTKEALRLALEALEHACGDRCNAEYNPCFQREAITAIKEALANEALEKMAENARELGLDYEPAQPEFIKHEVKNADNWSEWVCPDPKNYLMKCCDCGLVHEAQFGVVRYKSETEREDCDIVDDPNLQSVFRMRRSEEWTPEDTAHRSGGLPMAQPEQEPVKLWLWKNFVDGKPEYWAFDNAFPINLNDGDPQTLGEPCGYAWLKPSRQGRFDVSDEEVLSAVQNAKEYPPQRKPLTDEEIQDLLMPVRISGDGYYLRIARAIEAAHGIKENT
jgi:hypothetical protein